MVKVHKVNKKVHKVNKKVYKVNQVHKVYFNETVCNKSIGKFINKIKKILSCKNKSSHIMLIINSPGGSVIEGLKIINFINTCHIPIYTTVNGTASGISALISINGKKTYITKNSNIMLLCNSQSSIPQYNIPDEIIQCITFFDKELKKLFNKIVTSKGLITKKELNKLVKNGEYCFDTEECIKYGIIDEKI